MRPNDRGTVEERFWAKVQRTESCWPWKASRGGKGYGWFYAEKHRSRRAHRIAYELLVGPIQDGKQLHHVCRNRLCVNPAHLEPVTPLEHAARRKK